MTRLPNDSELFEIVGGVHYPKYDFWWNWVEGLKLDSESAEPVWTQLLHRWTSFLVEDFGDVYRRVEDDEFVLLSSMPERSLRLLLDFARKAQKFIKTHVVTEFDDGTPILVLVFEDAESYSNYVAPVYGMGGADFLPSNGVYLSIYTYPHIVLLADGDVSLWERTLSHELAHFYLSAYQLPRWVDEGVATLVEQDLTGQSQTQLNEEMLVAHRNYWNTSQVEKLLNGESFEIADESISYPYQLSEFIVRTLASEGLENLKRFIRTASRDDGGLKAAREVYDIDLRGLISEVVEHQT